MQICRVKRGILNCLSGLLEVVGANYFQTAQKKSSMKWGTDSWNYIRDPFEKSASLPGSQSPPGITGYLNNPGVPSIDVGWTEWIGIFFQHFANGGTDENNSAGLYDIHPLRAHPQMLKR